MAPALNAVDPSLHRSRLDIHVVVVGVHLLPLQDTTVAGHRLRITHTVAKFGGEGG